MERIPLSEVKKRLAPFRSCNDEVKIAPESKVSNVSKMIDSHISVLEANTGNRAYLPYYERLLVLLKVLESGLLS